VLGLSEFCKGSRVIRGVHALRVLSVLIILLSRGEKRDFKVYQECQWYQDAERRCVGP
jgi:hypothetical protein